MGHAIASVVLDFVAGRVAEVMSWQVNSMQAHNKRCMHITGRAEGSG